MSKVIFIFEGQRVEIQCKNEDRMRDICIKLAIKIDKNINNLYFLYDGKIINLELKYKEIINSINRNEMNILVYEKEGIICPKCGENININEKEDEIKEKLIGIKDLIEILINSNNMSMNKIINQLKNIIIIIDNMLKENKRNEIKKVEDRIIKGIIDIELNDINKDIVLYKSKEEIDVYINNEKINIINEGDKKIYKFNKEGRYEFKLKFKNDITNLRGFFEECKEIISLDLSNFNTSKVTDMGFMFNNCNKLKEIKGINKFNTNNVTNMTTMFQECNELISLDLSNFNTSKVTDMGWMFFNCNKLEYLNILNFNIKDNCNTKNIINNIKNNCNIKANNNTLKRLYN